VQNFRCYFKCSEKKVSFLLIECRVSVRIGIAIIVLSSLAC